MPVSPEIVVDIYMMCFFLIVSFKNRDAATLHLSFRQVGKWSWYPFHHFGGIEGNPIFGRALEYRKANKLWSTAKSMCLQGRLIHTPSNWRSRNVVCESPPCLENLSAMSLHMLPGIHPPCHPQWLFGGFKHVFTFNLWTVPLRTSFSAGLSMFSMLTSHTYTYGIG